MRGKNWTTKELKAASVLWKQGLSLEDMGKELHRTRESVKYQTQTRRDYFPRRKQERTYFADKVNVKIPISEAVHKAMKAEAKERGISLNMLIRETLKNRFVRKIWKLPESTSTAKVKFSNGSPAR